MSRDCSCNAEPGGSFELLAQRGKTENSHLGCQHSVRQL